MRARALLISGLMVATVVVPATSAAAVDEIDTTRLRNAVTVNGILQHERVLQRIANTYGGTRASGTEGYAASVAYVSTRLRAAGYRVTEQTFDFPFFQELAPATLVQESPSTVSYDVNTLEYSGSGTVSGPVVAALNNVPPTPEPSSAAGCLPEDFAPASPTQPLVALVQRGTCTFGEKAANASAAGYDAIIIYNEGNPGRTDLYDGTLGGPTEIPAVAISFQDGAALEISALAGPTTVRVSTETFSEIRSTSNVIADTPTGDPDKVVVVGAHLDSVIEGPGINDNGSGVSTILEIALEGAKLGVIPKQKVRFAFWGAEESGLLGSDYYVDNLSDADLQKIYANLNFDMLGSPNYVRFVYDGDGSSEGILGPPGSGQIEAIFTEYFEGKGLATDPTAFNGRSDYGPFILAGIPAGGLFSGAEGVKTPEQAAIYGGVEAEPYDSCYHLLCDDITNLSTRALYELGDAAAHAVGVLALTETGFFEDGSRMAASAAVTEDQFTHRGSHLIR